MISLLTFGSLALTSPKLAAFVLPLAQAATDTYDQPAQNPVAGAIGGLVGLVIGIIAVISLWKIFSKAGQPGWSAIVPFYNFYVMRKVAGKPGWWLLLMFVPFVNFVILILVCLGLASSFGKGTGFGLGLIFLNIIFLPILAFGDARYHGSTATPPAVA